MPRREPEHGPAEEHDHRLERERHRRERQRNADLRGGGGQRGEQDDGAAWIATVMSRLSRDGAKRRCRGMDDQDEPS